MSETAIKDTIQAINAINNEVDYCDQCITMLSQPVVDNVRINSREFYMTNDMGQTIQLLMLNYYSDRRRQLIARGHDLMK
jgi:hypothetical protein